MPCECTGKCESLMTQRQDYNYLLSWYFLLQSHALWLTGCVFHVPAAIEYYFIWSTVGEVYHYIDDVVILSKDYCQHFKDIEKMLTKLHHAKVALKLPIFHFLSKSVKYHGHIHKPDGLAAFLRRFTQSTPLPSRQTGHKWYHFWQHSLYTKDLSIVFLKSFVHSVPNYEHINN